MRVRLLLALHVVLAESQLSAYVGDSVTLPSKISPSLNITSIKWWVFFNETWIATYRGEKTNTDLFYLYRGRLDLNATSGDLTIRNVRTEDGTKYTVEIITADRKRQEAKVKLVVRQHLQKPIITTVVSAPTERGCLIWLACTSPDEGVVLSWLPGPMRDYALQGRHEDALVLSAFFNQPTKFTCISSRDRDSTSANVSRTCKPQTDLCPRNNCGLLFLLGLIVGVLIPAVLFCFRDKVFKETLS